MVSSKEMKQKFTFYLPYLAWVISLIATLGSLTFGELVFHLPPCVLCWYQRILMYPLVVIIAIGIVKKDKFLPEIGKPLLSSYLHKLGAVFAVVSNGAKNLSEAMTIASQALRHSPDNHASPAQNYTIVNYRKRGQPYDQGEAIKLFDEN